MQPNYVLLAVYVTSKSLSVPQLNNMANAYKNRTSAGLTPEEKRMYEFFLISSTCEFTSRNLSQKDYHIFNTLFTNHCFKPCPVTGPLPCLVHSQHFSYCLYGHFINHQDPAQCTFCSSFGNVRLFPRYRDTWDSFPRDKKAAFQDHFDTCAGCWKCIELNRNRDMLPPFTPAINYFAFSREFGNGTRASEQDLIAVPNSIFYSTEREEIDARTGYLRIIPLNFENEVIENNDYKVIVRKVLRDRHYLMNHKMEIAGVNQKERLLKALIMVDRLMPTALRLRRKYHVGIVGMTMERLSLALKEYIEYIVRCCKEEFLICHDEERIVITKDEMILAIKHNKYLVPIKPPILFVVCENTE